MNYNNIICIIILFLLLLFLFLLVDGLCDLNLKTKVILNIVIVVEEIINT
jgi:hypothetical protein